MSPNPFAKPDPDAPFKIPARPKTGETVANALGRQTDRPIFVRVYPVESRQRPEDVVLLPISAVGSIATMGDGRALLEVDTRDGLRRFHSVAPAAEILAALVVL